jgi:hypothetical protein
VPAPLRCRPGSGGRPGSSGLLGASSAHAGTLQSETLTLTVQGQAQAFLAGPFSGSGDTGASTGTSATIAAGSGFSGETFDVPATSNAGVTDARVTLGSHGAIHITPAGATVTAPQTGRVAYLDPYGTLLTIPIAAGLVGTLVRTEKIPVVGNFLVTVIGTGWHTGQVKATGLTYGSVAAPNVTATGSFNLSSRGGGTVTLVTLARVRTSGLAVMNDADPALLHLSFLPEPGASLLLGVAAARLLALGRRRRAA